MMAGFILPNKRNSRGASFSFIALSAFRSSLSAGRPQYQAQQCRSSAPGSTVNSYTLEIFHIRSSHA